MAGQQSHSSGKGVSELPSCLIQVILVKLPVKIVVICKCVCKSWNQLILDPYFTSLYSKNSPFTAMLLLQFPQANRIPFPIDRDFRFIEIGSNDDISHTRFNLDTLIPTTQEIAQGEYRIKRLVGSVNGLVCVVLIPYILKDGRCGYLFRYKSELFFVINPLTGESLKLPQVKGNEDECYRCHGFGSTVDGDYYKIVRIKACVENGEVRWELKILTVGVDDEWRDLDNPVILDDKVLFSGGVALNGALHWVVVDLESRIESVYAFDVGKEIGCCIPCPSYSSIGDIGVWDGHMCIVQGNENGFGVWTMRQYGVADSWTKDIILRNSNLSQNICSVAIPKTTRRNGDLLLSIVSRERRKSFISFNSKTKNYVKLDEVYDDEDTTSDLFEYAPCFSSLSRQGSMSYRS